MVQLTFTPGLTLTGIRTTRPSITIYSNPSMLHFHLLFHAIISLRFNFFFFFILQPYFNVHGQLVRPAVQDSGDERRPEPSRQNTLSPDPGIPLNQVQPRGSESEDRDEQDNDTITYVM